MSTALAKFNLKQTRPKQSEAGIGASLAYNEIIRDVLPPIVNELEKKITDLQEKVNNMKELLELVYQKFADYRVDAKNSV